MAGVVGEIVGRFSGLGYGLYVLISSHCEYFGLLIRSSDI